MSAEHDAFYNLAQRIEDAYSEIDSDIITNLNKTDSEYASIRRDAAQI